MNSIWNNNLELFKVRFPLLYDNIKELISVYDANVYTQDFNITVEQCKNLSYTLREHNVYLHSRYNPQREAQQLIADFDNEFEAAAFLGFGLGYGIAEFASKYPTKTLILIEPDIKRLLLALWYFDWSTIFSHSKLILLAGCDYESASAVIHKYNPEEIKIYMQSSWICHDPTFFDNLVKKIRQKRQADQVNTNTLEKFSNLWMRNSLYNLTAIQKLDGIQKYQKKAENIPFVIIAAGPSLETVLPYINDIKKRSILVCVDTAVHALLRNGVEPDFIILADPQYYCARHLDFMSCPSSTLITEQAAWPSVFRFNCKKVELFSSMYPVGQYFESKIESRGKLGAGGSVSTTAWDFARFCGCKEIYIAGMDLGFPGKQTHIKGSQFEEEIHRKSDRLLNAETYNTRTLITSNPQYVQDYTGKELLSDQRMTVFAWWFTQNCTTAAKNGQITYTLTPQSCKIDGIKLCNIQDFLSKPKIPDLIQNFTSLSEENCDQKEQFIKLTEAFSKEMTDLEHLSKKGIELCTKIQLNKLKAQEIMPKLQELDSKILSSNTKDAAALVFPTKRQLDELTKDSPDDPILKNIYYSKTIYTSLYTAVKKYTNILNILGLLG